MCSIKEENLTEKPLEFSLLQALPRLLPDSLVVMDDLLRVIYLNPKAERLFGFSLDEFAGKPIVMRTWLEKACWASTHPNSAKPLRKFWGICLRGGWTPDQVVPDILADENAVRQEFTNLLNNDLKFSPNGGRVEVS